jgi:SRSO17 transposase
MSAPRKPRSTLNFVAQDWARYPARLAAVRSFNPLQWLPGGRISELPRTSLPAIAKAVGLPKGQALHHVFAASPWTVEAFRQRRLALVPTALRGRPVTVGLDEPGANQQGQTTEDVARQGIGQRGKRDQGLVAVQASGVLAGIPCP